MASTLNLLQAVRAKDFVEAKAQFSALIQDKMREVLAREYQETAKSIAQSDK